MKLTLELDSNCPWDWLLLDKLGLINISDVKYSPFPRKEPEKIEKTPEVYRQESIEGKVFDVTDEEQEAIDKIKNERAKENALRIQKEEEERFRIEMENREKRKAELTAKGQ